MTLIDQLSYIESVKPIIDNEKLKDRHGDTNASENHLLRGLVGQLNLITNTTRPDV